MTSFEQKTSFTETVFAAPRKLSLESQNSRRSCQGPVPRFETLQSFCGFGRVSQEAGWERLCQST